MRGKTDCGGGRAGAALGLERGLAILVVGLATLSGPLAYGQEPAAAAKPRIAVLDFKLVDVEPAQGVVMIDRLRSDLVKTGSYIVLDRAQSDKILEELERQQTGLSDVATATRIGEQFNVQRIVAGRVAELKDLKIIQANVEMIELRTAQILLSETITHDGDMRGFILDQVPRLAQLLAGVEAKPKPPVVAAPAPPIVQAPVPPPAPAPEPAPEEVTADETYLRIYLSPLTAFGMGLALTFGETQVTETFGGVGAGLGLDLIIADSVALWVAAHFGTITAWEAQSDGFSTTLEEVDGRFRTVALGLDAVFGGGPWRFLAGAGLFRTSAEFQGFSPELGQFFDSDASLAGLLLDLRLDYTFDGGLLLGAGFDLGFGAASGTESEGADTATGTMLLFYVPVGFSF
jgi:hypothetical protein